MAVHKTTRSHTLKRLIVNKPDFVKPNIAKKTNPSQRHFSDISRHRDVSRFGEVDIVNVKLSPKIEIAEQSSIATPMAPTQISQTISENTLSVPTQQTPQQYNFEDALLLSETHLMPKLPAKSRLEKLSINWGVSKHLLGSCAIALVILTSVVSYISLSSQNVNKYATKLSGINVISSFEVPNGFKSVKGFDFDGSTLVKNYKLATDPNVTISVTQQKAIEVNPEDISLVEDASLLDYKSVNDIKFSPKIVFWTVEDVSYSVKSDIDLTEKQALEIVKSTL